MPSPVIAGSILPVPSSFCCQGAMSEIFPRRWSRECTDGRTPSQGALSLSFTHTSTVFTHRQYFFSHNHPPALCYPAAGWSQGRGLQREAGVALWPFLCSLRGRGELSAVLLALQCRWKCSVRGPTASPHTHAGAPG